MNALPRSARTRRAGLGLVEAVLSLAIAATLLTAVAAAYAATSSAIEINDQFFRATQSARVSVNQVVAGIRGCTSGLVDPNSIELEIGGQTRIYAYHAASKELRLTLPGAAGSPTYTLARNVTAAEFFTEGASISMTMTIEIGNNRITLNGSAMPRQTLPFE